MQTLHVFPNKAARADLRELQILAAEAPSETAVCFLGARPAKWEVHGAQIVELQRRRWLDPEAYWRLREVVRKWEPMVVCAWGAMALRAVRVAAAGLGARVVVRRPLGGDGQTEPGWVDKLLLQTADAVMPATAADAGRLAALGISPARLALMPTGALAGSQAPEEPPRPTIVCHGPLERVSGFYQAIWAFDILRFVNNQVNLVVCGAGSERRRLERFARSGGSQTSVQFAGEVDVEDAVTHATIVCVPSLTDCGAATALAAMVAGRPVVASRQSGLVEILGEHEAGLLVPPNNPMALAGAIKRLLEDDQLRRSLCREGQRRVRELFPARRLVDAWRLAVA
jgi:glycosyltransferase involved in cell wall biosynthesis